MDPEIQYVRSADGANIAFCDMGAGTPLIFSPNIWDHLTVQWRGEAKGASLQLVRDGFRLIRYDMRGMGMSDGAVSDFSIDAQLADLEALRERVAVEQFALYSLVHAAPSCIAYAARYPERVTHLMLHLPFADGEAWYQGVPTLRGLESFRALGDEQWELYTIMHATALRAKRLEAGVDVRDMAASMRAATSPETLRRYLEALRSQNVTAFLGQVRAPTLVLELRGGIGRHFSRVVASGIPRARLIEVAPHDLAPSIEIAGHVTRFVLGRAPRPSIPAEGGNVSAPPSDTAVILFADIVDSTALTERIGNAAFRERSRQLEDALRGAMRNHAGAPVEGRTLGDGVLGVFTSAAQAIAAAVNCADAAMDCGFALHLGLHAGDIMRESGNVYGLAVSVASRISGLSAPNEILVSSTVRDLARASASVTFEDRGDHALKGVADPQRLYAVRPLV